MNASRTGAWRAGLAAGAVRGTITLAPARQVVEDPGMSARKAAREVETAITAWIGCSWVRRAHTQMFRCLRATTVITSSLVLDVDDQRLVVEDEGRLPRPPSHACWREPVRSRSCGHFSVMRTDRSNKKLGWPSSLRRTRVDQRALLVVGSLAVRPEDHPASAPELRWISTGMFFAQAAIRRRGRWLIEMHGCTRSPRSRLGRSRAGACSRRRRPGLSGIEQNAAIHTVFVTVTSIENPCSAPGVEPHHLHGGVAASTIPGGRWAGPWSAWRSQ